MANDVAHLGDCRPPTGDIGDALRRNVCGKAEVAVTAVVDTLDVITSACAAVRFQRYRVGCALRHINERRLFRRTHETLEQWAIDRHHIGRSRSYQLIHLANIVDNVSTVVDVGFIISDRVARALHGLTWEVRSRCCASGATRSGTGAPARGDAASARRDVASNGRGRRRPTTSRASTGWRPSCCPGRPGAAPLATSR